MIDRLEATLEKYNSLTEAFENVTEENNKVTLLKDIITREDTILIKEGQNLKFDLNGHIIDSYRSDALFINNGTFEITDESDEQTGKITGQLKTVIENHNSLTVSGGYFYISSSYSGKDNNTKIIYNTEKQVLVIDSIINNVPLPAFYL